MIVYTNTTKNIMPSNLQGFFVGWPNPPTPEKHLRILKGSMKVILAVEKEGGNVVGFITAVGDGELCAYIPLLEVLPRHQKQGIGRKLVRRMLDELKGFYMVDLICDENLRGFYERFGMTSATGMIIRNRQNI
jgi:predicted N-acetyltransferase YhbS